MATEYNLPRCRQCPGSFFELSFAVKGAFQPSRFIPICHALHVIPETVFDSEKINESQFISRANVQTVEFKLPDNCPFLEELRSKGLAPWPVTTIDKTGIYNYL